MQGVDRSRDIQAILRGYRESRVVMTFAELGIGDALADGPKTPGEIAAAINADESATARFLRAAEVLGLLSSEDGHYRNTEMAADALTTDGKYSLVNYARREASFYRRWTHLTDAVRSGHRPEENRRDERDPDWVRNFTLALWDASRVTAPVVAETLEPVMSQLGSPVRVIDVGGGHGEYSLSLARRYPDARAVVFDRPPVIEVTREIIDKAQLSDRVDVLAGDFRIDSLGSGYDVALLFGVLVGQDAAAGVDLLGRVREVMNPGGFIVVRGHYVDRKTDEADTSSALFDLHMLLSTDGGAAHSMADIGEWMRHAGIEPQAPLDLPQPASGRLLIGRVSVS